MCWLGPAVSFCSTLTVSGTPGSCEKTAGAKKRTSRGAKKTKNLLDIKPPSLKF
jgi:hypothetical protein